MKRSTQVLALHCFLLQAMILSALSSPLLAAWFPEFYEQKFFPIYIGFVLGSVIGWSPRFGGCSLTLLENQYRKLENKPTYDEPVITHYIPVITGVRVPQRIITPILYAIMLLPVLVRLL